MLLLLLLTAAAFPPFLFPTRPPPLPPPPGFPPLSHGRPSSSSFASPAPSSSSLPPRVPAPAVASSSPSFPLASSSSPSSGSVFAAKLAEFHARNLGLSAEYVDLAKWFASCDLGVGFLDFVSSSFPHLVRDLARDFSTGSSCLLSALHSSSPSVSFPSRPPASAPVPPPSSSPSVPPFVARFPVSSFSAPPRFPAPFPSPLPPSAPPASSVSLPLPSFAPAPPAPLPSPPPPSSLLPSLSQSGVAVVVPGGSFDVPFSSSSSSSSTFLGVPLPASLAPSSGSVGAGAPVSSAAHAVPVAQPPPLFDPLVHTSVPRFDDSNFEHGDSPFDDDEAPFADPSAPPLPLDSSRFEYRRMVEYILGLFPQVAGVPPSAMPPRTLFKSFFATSTPSSPDLHFNWFDRVRQSLLDADSRIASFLSSGRSDRVFMPFRRPTYAVCGDHAGARAVPVNESLFGTF